MLIIFYIIISLFIIFDRFLEKYLVESEIISTFAADKHNSITKRIN